MVTRRLRLVLFDWTTAVVQRTLPGVYPRIVLDPIQFMER